MVERAVSKRELVRNSGGRERNISVSEIGDGDGRNKDWIVGQKMKVYFR